MIKSVCGIRYIRLKRLREVSIIILNWYNIDDLVIYHIDLVNV